MALKTTQSYGGSHGRTSENVRTPLASEEPRVDTAYVETLAMDGDRNGNR